METILFVLAATATIIVALILIFGIRTFKNGGEFNRKNANKIMRWRIGMQFVAVLLIAAFVYVRSIGG